MTQLIGWMRRYRDLIAEHRDYLTELDAAIGDADHGINLARGMGAVMDEVQAASAGTVEDLLRRVGMALVKTVGGAAGPLYGTFFLRFAGACGPVQAVNGADLARALEQGLDGVKARGRAQVGDKTMVDALEPAAGAVRAAVEDGAPLREAVRRGQQAAEEGSDATLPLVARKGRASYLGERSAGHLDPGAASSALLFRALAESLDDPTG